ncbi:MAG: Gldg family protein [Acetobacteraceae bacterium]|nr:Gldg family protein [Acetobacteraceae bacterium]
MKRLLISLIALAGMGMLLLGLNMMAYPTLAGVQLDLTQQSLYSLAPGTRAVLAGLREPITLRLFYSPELGTRIPQYAAYSDRVRELLRAYAALAPGKIRLEIHTPEPFSEDEDHAAGYGLQGVPLDQSGQRVYFGLQGTNLLDDERAIAFFQPERERFLEYDLTKLVLDLANPDKPVVGLMTALPMEGDPQAMMQRKGGGPWAVMQALNQTANIRDVPMDATTIDPDIKVLMLVHPQNLSVATLYAIDQFVMRGGRLLAMVAPTNEAMAQTQDSQADTSSNLKRLFAAWGIVYDPEQAVGDLDGAWKVRGQSQQPETFVGYFSVRDGINRDDPAMSDLQEVVLANPGFLSVTPQSHLTLTPLLSTSDHSATLPASAFRQEPDPAKILDQFHPDGLTRIVAARLRGQLHSAFSAAPEGASGTYLADSQGVANLVVIADTDFLSDRFWTRSADFFGASNSTPFADNGTLIQNLVGTLAGGDALIGLRSRGGVSRPFDVVDALRRDAETRFRETETALSHHLDEASKQLDDLRGGRDGSANAALSAEQLAAIDGLKHDIADTRGKLRQVQFNLRHDIATLKLRLQMFDIVAVPALLTLAAMAIALVRTVRRRRRAA